MTMPVGDVGDLNRYLGKCSCTLTLLPDIITGGPSHTFTESSSANTRSLSETAAAQSRPADASEVVTLAAASAAASLAAVSCASSSLSCALGGAHSGGAWLDFPGTWL